jgi:hypothetical protein
MPPRTTIPDIINAYRAAYREAGPASRADVNAQFRPRIEEARRTLGAEIESLRRQLIATADDPPSKAGLQRDIAGLGAQAQDAADLIALIDERAVEDERNRVRGEVATYVAKQQQIRKQFGSLESEYVKNATALRKVLTQMRDLRLESDGLTRLCEKLVDEGYAEAEPGIIALGSIRGVGKLDELVELPSLVRGPALFGTSVTEDERPPRPEIPPLVPDSWGQSTEQQRDGSLRVLQPVPGTEPDRRRLAQIAEQNARRETAIAAAKEWDREYGSDRQRA